MKFLLTKNKKKFNLSAVLKNMSPSIGEWQKGGYALC